MIFENVARPCGPRNPPGCRWHSRGLGARVWLAGGAHVRPPRGGALRARLQHCLGLVDLAGPFYRRRRPFYHPQRRLRPRLRRKPLGPLAGHHPRGLGRLGAVWFAQRRWPSSCSRTGTFFLSFFFDVFFPSQSAVADVDGLIVVFAVANDGQIYYVRQDRNDIFGNWTQVTPIDANIAAGTKNLVLARVKSIDARPYLFFVYLFFFSLSPSTAVSSSTSSRTATCTR